MEQFLHIFILGWGILFVAIAVNFLAGLLGFDTWYGFLSHLSETGFKEIVKFSWLNLMFLFVIYPLILGTAAYYIMKILQ